MSTYNEIFLGGSIKSIQRGQLTVPPAGANATITAVNTAKTELRYLGHYHGGGSTFDDIGCSVYLLNSTTVRATRGGSSGSISVSWELTEYY